MRLGLDGYGGPRRPGRIERDYRLCSLKPRSLGSRPSREPKIVQVVSKMLCSHLALRLLEAQMKLRFPSLIRLFHSDCDLDNEEASV